MKRTILSLLIVTAVAAPVILSAQKSKANKAAFYTGVYRNVFREAGYSQAAIDEKVAKAWHDLFEGSNPGMQSLNPLMTVTLILIMMG